MEYVEHTIIDQRNSKFLKSDKNTFNLTNIFLNKKIGES